MHIYGHERLASVAGNTRTWYGTDALGSVRQTLDDAGGVARTTSYDPWGQVTQGTVATWGFTGELQQGDAVYLRARWYQPSAGTLLGRDPFGGYDSLPYSLHPYQYAYSDPVRLTDPSGKCVEWVWGDPTCQFIGWERILHGDLEWEDGRPWGGAALDFTPGVGDVKGLIEVFTGCDIVTGEDLGNWRWAGLLFVSESRQLRHLKALPAPPTHGRVNPIGEQGPFYSNSKGQTYSQAQYNAVMARRVHVMAAVEETMQPFLPRIRAVVGPDARIGYRGSLASGTVGNTKKEKVGMPVNLDDFDIDFLIIDDRFAATIPKRRGQRWGSMNQDLRGVMRSLEAALRSRPEMAGLRKKDFDFRIWTEAEEAAKFPPGSVVYFP
jgi:RHS repeat-associated protein